MNYKLVVLPDGREFAVPANHDWITMDAMLFQSLDAFVDSDIGLHKSRGEI